MRVGPRENAAADFGHIPALAQNHAIGDNLDFAGCEPCQRGIALGLRRGAVDVFTAHAGFHKFIADVDAVLNADGECDGAAPLTEFVPVGNDVADKLWAIHPVGELVLNVVAEPGVNALQIGLDRRINPRRHQPALRNQVGHLGHSMMTSKMLPSPRPSPRHGVAVRPKHDGVGISGDDLAIGSRRAVVGSSITNRSAGGKVIASASACLALAPIASAPIATWTNSSGRGLNPA